MIIPKSLFQGVRCTFSKRTNGHMRALVLCFLILTVCEAAVADVPAITSVSNFITQFAYKSGQIDHVKLWNRLGVKSQLFTEHPNYRLSQIRAGNYSCQIVILSNLFSTSWQYLVFQPQTNGTWRCQGNIDFADEHYEEPSARIEIIERKAWLVFQHMGGYGTGFLFRKETWYPLTNGMGKSELDYLVEGQFSDEIGNSTEYSTQNLTNGTANGIPFVQVAHEVVRKRVGQKGESRAEGKSKVLTRFVWSGKEKHFVAVKPIADKKIILNEESRKQ